MRVEIHGKDRYGENFLSEIKKVLEEWTAPVIKKFGTEYSAIISAGAVSVFRVKIGQECHIISGLSMVEQIRTDCVNMGFVNIHSKDITSAVRTLIEEYWTIAQTESNGECAVVFSPQQKISDL